MCGTIQSMTRRRILISFASVGPVSSLFAQGRGRGKGRGHDNESAPPAKETATNSAGSYFRSDDYSVLKRYYSGPSDLPPGLRKKYARTGTLPPGWEKKIRPFPAELV